MRYCIGDVHGCIKTLDHLINKIYRQDANPLFYFVGDLIDRGPDSKSVLDLIMELNTKDMAWSVLGNHELMMINTYSHNLTLALSMWKQNGAQSTLFSFNPEANLQLPVNQLIPEKYYQFIHHLPYYLELDDYFIVHAGFDFNAKNPFTQYESMVWTRDEKNDSHFTKGKTIIHGHTPVPIEQIVLQISYKTTDIINIDSGCVYKQHKSLGNLSAFNMDKKTITTIKNIDF